MSETKTKKWGLALDFPHAPATPHAVTGFEGLFTADEPRPLEECRFAATPEHGVRPISLDAARKIDRDDNVPLKLVQLKG